ncbi:MAG: ShlB/FhaC/HecB family hemolysin secretion/activation protein [Betaproteobacteria bacterium]
MTTTSLINFRAASLLLLTAIAAASQAQQVPNSGTAVQEVPKASLPVAPATAAPQLVLPNRQRALSVADQAGWSEKVRVSDIQIAGNSQFNSATLLATVAELKGQTVELSRVVDAIEAIRKVYLNAGYLLTDVYLPEQQLSPAGAVIQVVVVEARIGKVNTLASGSATVPLSKAKQIVDAQLRPGAAIKRYELERVVYLLKDMPGLDASATLTAGANVGESDITIDVFAREGKSVSGSIGVDNLGVGSTGEYHATAMLSVDHPFNVGDQFSLMLQPASLSGNSLVRAGYTLPVGPYATKLNLSASSSAYRLGAPFEGLGASGKSDVYSMTVIQPLERGRLSNSVLIGGIDYKDLKDTVVGQDLGQKIDTARLGVLGFKTYPREATVQTGAGASGFATVGGQTSYSVIATSGNVKLDPSTDPLNTLGGFVKVNFDLQYVQFFTDGLSLSAVLSGQMASKNLRPSERVSFGGPNGVRGYAVSTGTADEGAVLSLEARYRIRGEQAPGMPLSATAFYDTASITNRKNPVTLDTNLATFSSFGLGLRAGTEGRFTASLQIATRLGGSYPIATDGTTSEVSERRPQVWFTLQNWF